MRSFSAQSTPSCAPSNHLSLPLNSSSCSANAPRLANANKPLPNVRSACTARPSTDRSSGQIRSVPKKGAAMRPAVNCRSCRGSQRSHARSRLML